MFNQITRRASIVMCVSAIFMIVAVSAPMQASAQFVQVSVMSDTSAASVKRTTDTTMLQVKNYVLDGLAWSIAKILLQQVTSSVVNWINTGFKGNPSFITNPGSFFADSADQITGAFIANTGVLKDLCSPFNIDIRLSLALNMNVEQPKRYTCTLSTIINNANKSTVNVSGNATLNGKTIAGGNISANGSGATMSGFTSGDFSQGGWPAFISMTSEPQNNPYGAYQLAKEEISYKVTQKKNSIQMDLSLGRGFMSWQNCIDISADEASMDMYQKDSGGGGLSTKTDKNGNVTYQDCETQTPGSVIAGSIDKSLGIPQDTLNIAGSLNQIVGALFAQLVSKVLQGGLHAATHVGTSGNVTSGIASQLSAQSDNSQLQNSKSQMVSSINSYVANATQYAGLRQQIVTALSGASSNSQNIGSCYSTSLAQAQANLLSANARLNSAKDISSMANSATTVDQIQQVSTRYNSMVQGSVSGTAFVTSTELDNARNDLTTVQSMTSTNSSTAQQACAAYSSSAGSADSNYPAAYQQCVNSGTSAATCASQYGSSGSSTTSNPNNNSLFDQCIKAGFDPVDCNAEYPPAKSGSTGSTSSSGVGSAISPIPGITDQQWQQLSPSTQQTLINNQNSSNNNPSNTEDYNN